MNSFSNVLCLKRRLRGDLTAVLSYTVGWYNEVAKVFWEGHSHTMKGNGDKDQQQKI